MPHLYRPRQPRGSGKTTDTYIAVRSTYLWAQWADDLARLTNKPISHVIEESLHLYSQKHGDPAGAPPPRNAR